MEDRVSDDLLRLLDAIAFQRIVDAESKRTLIVEPHRHAQIQAAVDGAGANRWLTVLASPACPAGKILVIDEQAMDAAMNEMASRPIRFFGC